MNINNADELKLFYNNLKTYKKVKVGLLFNGMEIDYPDYQRVKVELKIKERRISIFSNVYKFMAYNLEFFDFPETSFELVEINGIIVDCKGIIITQSRFYQKLVFPTTIRFNPKHFVISYWHEK